MVTHTHTTTTITLWWNCHFSLGEQQRARARQSRDIRRRSVDVRLREKCSVNAINAHCLDPVSNQFERGSIFGAV